MRENVGAAGITLRESPIENPGAISTFERYHAPLRRVYKKVRMEISREFTDKECLEMESFAIKSSIGPEGLCPMLLVFGVIPARHEKPHPQHRSHAHGQLIGQLKRFPRYMHECGLILV